MTHFVTTYPFLRVMRHVGYHSGQDQMRSFYPGERIPAGYSIVARAIGDDPVDLEVYDATLTDDIERFLSTEDRTVPAAFQQTAEAYGHHVAEAAWRWWTSQMHRNPRTIGRRDGQPILDFPAIDDMTDIVAPVLAVTPLRFWPAVFSCTEKLSSSDSLTMETLLAALAHRPEMQIAA